MRQLAHMRAIAIAIFASALLILLCWVANSTSNVSLYQSQYPSSNYRRGPHEFSPYSREGGVPPVYSAEDVDQRNVWTGYNFIQPVIADYSYTPAAAHIPLAPEVPLIRQPSQNTISSRFYMPFIVSALRRGRQELKALQQQVVHLQNVVHIALTQPISEGKLTAREQHARLEALSARVHELQFRISKIEAIYLPSRGRPQFMPGLSGPYRTYDAGIQDFSSPRASTALTDAIGHAGPDSIVLTASEARRILGAVAELDQEVKLMQRGHKWMSNLRNSVPINLPSKKAHAHPRRIIIKLNPKKGSEMRSGLRKRK